MKYLSMRLKGYKMIKSGLNLDEIFIDFQKQKHKLCIIVGDNGSGKTTLINALTLYPDDKNQFIDFEDAEKEIWAINGDIIYRALFISKPTNTSSSRTTKAYLEKNGVELNPNGNVNSYKEIMEAEFDFDYNALLLSFLSFNQRGLADMKPGERKRYISNIISALNIYNNMNKNFSKKASIIRSHINSVHNKISSIGNAAELSVTLDALDIKVTSLKQKHDALNSTITASETIISSIDPDKSIQESYQEIYNSLNSLNTEIEAKEQIIQNLNNKLKIIYSKDISYEDAIKELECLTSTIGQIKETIIKTESKLESAAKEIEKDSDLMKIKQSKLEGYNSNYDTSILDKIHELQQEIEKSELYLENNNVYWDMTESEVNKVIDILNNIFNSIYAFYDAYDEKIIKQAADCRIDVNIGNKYKEKLLLKEAELENTLVDLDKQIEEMEEAQNGMEDLKRRPDPCTNDSCYFIRNLVKLTKKYKDKDIDEILIGLKDARRIVQISLDDTKKQIISAACIDEALFDLDEIQSFIKSNSMYINRISCSYKINKKSTFLEAIKNCASYEWIGKFIEDLKTASTEQKNYEEKKILLDKLIQEETISKANENIITELKEDIDTLDNNIQLAQVSVNELLGTIDFNKKILDSYNQKYELLKSYIDMNVELEKCKEKKEELRTSYQKIKDNIKSISANIDAINNANSELQAVDTELASVEAQRDNYRYSLSLINQYQTEMQEYQEKYDMINTLKKYSSPNTGIQTLFVSMYMNKTKNMVNGLIKNFFDGELLLADYIINENEFRIPCTKGGWLIDDISSCSNAQICVLSMCISMALLQQASTIFNIPRWDEIDSGLDYNNRILFIQMIYHLIAMFDIEQSFLISHSSESVLTDVDIIALKYNFNDNPLYGNIIYNYSEEVNH